MTSSRIGHTGINLAPNSGVVLPSKCSATTISFRVRAWNIGGGAASR